MLENDLLALWTSLKVASRQAKKVSDGLLPVRRTMPHWRLVISKERKRKLERKDDDRNTDALSKEDVSKGIAMKMEVVYFTCTR